MKRIVTIHRLIGVLVAVLLGSADIVPAQSLAEIARKEKERRSKIQDRSDHDYTERDLRSAGGPITASTVVNEDGETAEGVTEQESQEAEEEEDPTRTPAYWQQRLDAVDRRIADAEQRLNRPGFEESVGNLFERQRLEQEIEEARRERQQIIDEARRQGIPPGWLR